MGSTSMSKSAAKSLSKLVTVRELARRLDRNPSTISRLVQRLNVDFTPGPCNSKLLGPKAVAAITLVVQARKSPMSVVEQAAKRRLDAC